MTLGLSAEDRSHIVSASYMVRPVKRLPSKPWSGWPSVRGMSAAVMPIRSVVSAAADSGSAVDHRQHYNRQGRPAFPKFLVRIAVISFLLQVTNSYANVCNAHAKGGLL